MGENNEMLDAYLFEANELLDGLDDLLIECEKNNEFDAESINTIFRTMHTIKGSSAMMEFDSMTTVSHKIEDLFSYIRENGFDCSHNKGMFDLLFRAADFLKSEIEKIQNGEPLTTNIGNLTDEINDFLKKISSGSNNEESDDGTSSDSNNTTDPSISNNVNSFKVFFDKDAKMENIRAFILLNNLLELLTNVKTIPENPQMCPAEEISKNGLVVILKDKNDYDKAIDIAKQFSYTDKIITNESASATENPPESNNASAPQEQQPEEKSKDAEKAPSETTHTDNKVAKPTRPASASPIINVNLSKLDVLIDLMGEIVIAESIATSIPKKDGFDLDKFSKATRQLQKLTGELQESIMSVRMMPINTVFNKMNRIVRDMSKKLDKDVELVMIGADTEVDKTIIDNIGDPIMHIVRNSMDHGIEPRDKRAETGKNPKGKITLKAENASGEVIVTIIDDGQGFDEDAILRKAKEKGLLMKPENQYTKKEIYSLLMMPGFSTNDKVTEYSGRGVGMDVVRSNIEKIGGTVTLNSERGVGSTVTIRIPLTLAIIDGMDIAVGKSIYTIPIRNIKQSFKASPEDIITDSNGQDFVTLRNKCYPIIRLHEYFNIEPEFTDFADGIMMLVETSDTAYCIFVDKLIEEQQIVIKPVPAYFNQYDIKEKGISGCAILGDGSISLILDVTTLKN